MNADARAGTPKLNQRRRAVHAALSTQFGDRHTAVTAGFRLFEREFAGQPHFVVTRFVSRCAELIGLADAERIALTRRTFELLAQPYESLPRFPDELLAGSGPTTPSPARAPLAAGVVPAAAGSTAAASNASRPLSFPTAAPLPAHATIAGAVARSLLAPVRAQARSQPAMIREIIGDAMNHATLPDNARERCLAWCLNGAADDTLLVDLDTPQLRRWIHVLYLAACDALGPVASDRLLAQAIARAGSLPAAVEYAPDQLL